MKGFLAYLLRTRPSDVFRLAFMLFAAGVLLELFKAVILWVT